MSLPHNTSSHDPRDALLDELLAVRCQLGEPAAFDALIERWHEPLGRYIERTLSDGQDANDVLQDTWLRVLRAMPSLRDPARLRPWLFGIARRTLMDRLRGRYTERRETPLDTSDGAESAAEYSSEEQTELEHTEKLMLLHETLTDMPFVEREVLVLFYLQELSLAQLAEVLAVPEGTVKSRLFRARRMLRERLIQKGVDG